MHTILMRMSNKLLVSYKAMGIISASTAEKWLANIKKYAKDFGVTAACAMQMLEDVEYSGENAGDASNQAVARAEWKAERYYGDSLFASVSVAVWFAK